MLYYSPYLMIPVVATGPSRDGDIIIYLARPCSKLMTSRRAFIARPRSVYVYYLESEESSRIRNLPFILATIVSDCRRRD